MAGRRKARITNAQVQGALAAIAKTVEARLDAFFSELESEPALGFFERPPDTPLIEQIRELTMRGGKRLRAGLLVAGAGLFDSGASSSPAVIDAAAAMEIRHTYLLIHDDIMDRDPIRRGGPSVHVSLSGFTGDERLGENLGILAGDLASALEQRLLLEMDVDPPRLLRVLQIFQAMHADVVQGQALDLLGEVSAAEVAIHKTASYTTIGPLIAGAALAGARDRDIERLSRIAQPLGVAFQFRDDLLGTFGDEGVTGKPVNSDLLEGKRTVLLEEAHVLADRYQRKRLEKVVGNPAATPKEIAAAREALVKCGAKAACEKHIEELTAEFIESIDVKRYAETARCLLVGIASQLAERVA